MNGSAQVSSGDMRCSLSRSSGRASGSSNEGSGDGPNPKRQFHVGRIALAAPAAVCEPIGGPCGWACDDVPCHAASRPRNSRSHWDSESGDRQKRPSRGQDFTNEAWQNGSMARLMFAGVFLGTQTTCRGRLSAE